MIGPVKSPALFPGAGRFAHLVAPARKLRPVAGRTRLRHLFGDIELVEETLCDDAISVVRLRPPVAHGAFTDLQAMDRLFPRSCWPARRPPVRIRADRVPERRCRRSARGPCRSRMPS